MKIPKTTKEQPYIEFRFTKSGKLKLKKSSAWYRGKNGGFWCSDGSEGNTCLPKHLNVYLPAYKRRKIKELEREIQKLQRRIKIFSEKHELV